MKALTLWQPWAWAMACGLKRIENRIWEPPASMLGQRFALHAGRKWHEPSNTALWELLDYDDPHPPRQDEAVHGAIVATTRLVAVVTNADAAARIGGGDQRRWFFGPYGWVVEDTRELDEPIYCRGLQRLWPIPAELEVPQ